MCDLLNEMFRLWQKLEKAEKLEFLRRALEDLEAEEKDVDVTEL